MASTSTNQQVTSESSPPGAGGILGVTKDDVTDAEQKPLQQQNGDSSAAAARNSDSDEALDSPAAPGLDLSIGHHHGSLQLHDHPQQAAEDFIQQLGGSVELARAALNALANNPALGFVLHVGGIACAMKAMEDAATSLHQSA